MIPESSLRKGIKMLINGKVATLKYFTETELYFEDLEPCKPEDAEPVPMSEYWLHYFMFVDDGFQKNPDKWIGHSQNQGFIYYLHGPQKGRLLTQNGIRVTIYPVLYVHQFQNAMYCFLGREVDYKIPTGGEKVYENGEYVRSPI